MRVVVSRGPRPPPSPRAGRRVASPRPRAAPDRGAAGRLVSRGACAAVVVAVAFLLACDGGKRSFAKGAEAEATGNFGEAADQYQAVCAAESPLCPAATLRGERLKVKAAWKSISAGDYGKAKETLEAAQAAADPAVRRAARAAERYAELVDGLALDDAAAIRDPELALARLEGLLDLGIPASVKAQAWVDAHRPGILLERVKAACHPKGTASCSVNSEALARAYPARPEAGEAKRLAAQGFARDYPLVRDAENLLIQRVELYDKDQLVEICMAQSSSPADEARGLCESQVVGSRHLPSVEYLDGAWKKKVADIQDPALVEALDSRYKVAAREGAYDPAAWPRPAK